MLTAERYEGPAKPGCAFDTFRLSVPNGAELVAAFVVDAPSPLFARKAYLSHLLALATAQEWDGTAHDLRHYLSSLRQAVLTDSTFERRRLDFGAVVAFSIGGIARTSDSVLVAFRIGKFRAVLNGRTALREQTLHDPTDPDPESLLLTGCASRHFPQDGVSESDFIQTQSSFDVVTVFYSYPFLSADTPWLLRMSSQSP